MGNRDVEWQSRRVPAGHKKFYEKRRGGVEPQFTVFDVELRRNEVFSVVSMLYNL
jgi:hypothetical protein